MILGASYNFFNGEEHLRASVRSIRNEVDHISVVYQKVSNRGNLISEEALDALSDLQHEGLIDSLCLYEPDLFKPAVENERIKRQIGIDVARSEGMTHFLSIDADEFYRDKELRAAKDFIEKNRILNTSVYSYMHILTPNWRARDCTNVSFITKLTKRTMIRKTYFVGSVDPTRRIVTPGPLSIYCSFPPFWRNHYHFDDNVISMYHMNLVRKDGLRSKFNNSSTNNELFFRDLENLFCNWVPGDTFIFPGKGRLGVKFVENEFNTWTPDDMKNPDS